MILPTWDLGLDDIQEPDELLTPVTLHAASDHLAVERGEQRGGAVPLLIMSTHVSGGCSDPRRSLQDEHDRRHFTSTVIPVRIPHTRMTATTRESSPGLFRQILSTRSRRTRASYDTKTRKSYELQF
jgi:hypothetical protein